MFRTKNTAPTAWDNTPASSGELSQSRLGYPLFKNSSSSGGCLVDRNFFCESRAASLRPRIVHLRADDESAIQTQCKLVFVGLRLRYRNDMPVSLSHKNWERKEVTQRGAHKVRDLQVQSFSPLSLRVLCRTTKHITTGRATHHRRCLNQDRHVPFDANQECHRTSEKFSTVLVWLVAKCSTAAHPPLK